MFSHLSFLLSNSNLVHNDFHHSHGLFPLFDGIEVADLDTEIVVDVVQTNGHDVLETNGTNGVNGVNGIKPAATDNAPLVNGGA
jgi:methylenetetrahydrofolate reductase (NADPH)